MSVTRRILLTVAILAATAAAAPPSAAHHPHSPSPTAAEAPRANRSFHAFADTGFSGVDRWFSGNTGDCVYVGDNWNDRIRSARTESGALVELWDNYNCTGGSIVIDRSGYSSIGKWVSAYRVSN